MRECLFAKLCQRPAQSLIGDSLGRRLGARAKIGIARRCFGASLWRSPAKRFLPHGDPGDAAPAEMRIDPVDQRAGHVLYVQAETRLDPQHEGCGLNRRFLRRVFRARRPFEAFRLADRRKPSADDRLPLRQQRRFAKALLGDQRIERPVDELREPARLPSRMLLHGHGRRLYGLRRREASIS